MPRIAIVSLKIAVNSLVLFLFVATSFSGTSAQEPTPVTTSTKNLQIPPTVENLEVQLATPTSRTPQGHSSQIITVITPTLQATSTKIIQTTVPSTTKTLPTPAVTPASQTRQIPPLQTVTIITPTQQVTTSPIKIIQTTVPSSSTGASGSTATILGFTIDSQSPSFQIFLEAISVLIFGGVVAFILEWRSRKYEQSQQAHTSNQAKLRYLKGIKFEIEAIIKPLQPLTILLDKQRLEEMIDRGEKRPNWITPLNFMRDMSKTTYWDALVPSGLLPSVVDADMLAKIANFYHQVRVFKNLIEDMKRETEQDWLRSASMRISPDITGMFQEQRLVEFAKENLSPTLLDLIQQGTHLLIALENEIKNLSPSEEYRESLEHPITSDTNPANDSSNFEDIYLLNLNEHLTHRKTQGPDSEIENEGENFDNEVFAFVLRLSNKPPDKWGDTVEYGGATEDEDYYWKRGRETAKIDGRYLIFEGTPRQLEQYLSDIKTSIANKNKEYRRYLKKEAEQKTRKMRMEKGTTDKIQKLKRRIDAAIAGKRKKRKSLVESKN